MELDCIISGGLQGCISVSYTHLYETNLTDTERRIAYNYEMQMCRTGKINGVNYQDSLFRGKMCIRDRLGWVRKMNNIRSRAEEVVLHDLIYR